jgi:uncharacterized protein
MAREMKKIPVEEGLFTIPGSPGEPVYLKGSKCSDCGRYFYPKVERCSLCESENIEDIKLGRKGKLYTFTNNFYPPPGGIYKGPVPYGLAMVKIDEGIIIPARLSTSDVSKLKAGTEVKLEMETLYIDDEGNEVVCFCYNPVS